MRRIVILSSLLGLLLAVTSPVSADIIGTGAPEPIVTSDNTPQDQSAPPDIIGTGEPEGSSLWDAFWLIVSL